MEQIVNNLHKLIDKKIELFEEILRITVKQKEDIAKNVANNIQELVDKKQLVINHIDEIDKAFNQQIIMIKKMLNIDSLENIDTLKYPRLAALKGKISGLFSISKNIMNIEKENMDNLNLLFNDIKIELKQINSGKKSIRAYEPTSIATDGIYIDRKK